MDSVVEDFSEDSTLETLEIYFHNSSVVDSVVEVLDAREQISDEISRSL